MFLMVSLCVFLYISISLNMCIVSTYILVEFRYIFDIILRVFIFLSISLNISLFCEYL